MAFLGPTLWCLRPQISYSYHFTYRALSSNASSKPSNYIMRSPSRSALREVPTPLVFLSASEWDEDSKIGMRALASMFPEQGFTCIETDLTMPEGLVSDSKLLMHHFESQLASDIRLAAIPFPPVIFARGSAALIAQTYISSNPATGLFFISPPTSNSTAHAPLPTKLEEFDYEPKFPIAIMASKKGIEVFKTEHRLGQSTMVDKIEIDNTDGQQAFVAIEQWLDELGI